MISTYNPGGKGHRALRAMSEGATYDHLAQSLGCRNRQQRRKVWHLVGGAMRHGFARRTGDIYTLTEEGIDALFALDHDYSLPVEDTSPPVTSVRVFARA